jgi:acyl-CoA synthetase (NDP forming)
MGYRGAIKAKAAALAHKSDAGGVALNIADEAALETAWEDMHARVAKAQPGLVLDGILIEVMAAKGVEMIIGARRDPDWGPVLLVGLGGIWTEALSDVRLMPAGLSRDQIVAELNRLRGARALRGLRGAPPVDLPTIADVVSRIGALMRERPEIREIDINPLIAYPHGVLALDALIVTD